MIIKIVLLTLFFINSCSKSPVIDQKNEDSIIIDREPPVIKWISPRFDATVNEYTDVKCQIIDESIISSVKLWVDSLELDISSNQVSDSLFTFNWKVENYNDGDMPELHIYASDSNGNDTISSRLRVVVDNNFVFPVAVNLFNLDSIFLDSTFIGYNISWSRSYDQYFNKYILNKSLDPLMNNYQNLFITENSSINEYNDYELNKENIEYYNLIVEDDFGKQSLSNVVSTSIISMPPQWVIKTVNYDSNAIDIIWDNIEYSKYLKHQILFSNHRYGEYNVLFESNNILENQYLGLYESQIGNWFSILTQDSVDQISISEPFLHPPPQSPIIDSVYYKDGFFEVSWILEPENDFKNYQVLATDSGDPFNLNEIGFITDRIENTFNYQADPNQYYLFQIITKDLRNFETRGPIIQTSSFEKFSITDNNSKLLKSLLVVDDKFFATGESDESEGLIVEINKYGEIIKSYNFEQSNSIFNSIISNYSGFYVTGSMGTNQNKNILLNYINEDMNLVWEKIYNIEYQNVGNSVINLTDGNLGIVGYSYINSINQDIIVIKSDPNNQGKEFWSVTIGGEQRDVGHDILPSENGGMYILGETHSQGDTDGDIWILELDNDGNIIDTLLIDLNGKQVGYSFIKSENNHFTIVGESSGTSGVTDALIIEINQFGNLEWIFNYGGAYNDLGYSLVSLDNSWIMAGQTYSFDIDRGDAWLINIDNLGRFNWYKTYGNIKPDIAYDVGIANDGGIIFCGSTYNNYNQSIGWLVKMDSRGNYNNLLTYP